MARAYIVEGTTGEYDDHQDWEVAVFTNKKRAERFCAKANDWLRARGLHTDEAYISDYRLEQARASKSPFDPHLHVDYTGASYDVLSAPLNPELPR